MSAGEIGFVAAGVAPAGPSKHAEAFRERIAAGFHASMDFLAKDTDRRLDVRTNWPWAKSVLCLAASYATGGEDSGDGRIARYARGRDYHRVFKKRCMTLADELVKRVDGLQTVCCVDTAPLLERELAAAAGIGWIGRNCCLIHPVYGSYILLAEIVLSIELPPDSPLQQNCGDCRKCLEACPNKALISPYTLDARRCNSWATVENRGPLDGDEFNLAGQVFGCDLCQTSCPYNAGRGTGVNSMAELCEPLPPAQMDVVQMLEWSKDEWDQATRASGLRRCGYEGLLRNAAIVAGQCKITKAAASLDRLSRYENTAVAQAAKWAAARL